MLFVACSSDGGTQAETLQTENDMKMYITIAGQTQSVVLANNAATQELVTRLHNGAVTVTLNSSGGFEIWGPLGFSLPTSNQQMMAQPGDVVLYNGSNICLFYGSNSWSYTRLGKIEGLSESQLRTFLKAGESNIIRLEKWDEHKIWTAILYDADNQGYPYIKRFHREYCRDEGGEYQLLHLQCPCRNREPRHRWYREIRRPESGTTPAILPEAWLHNRG